LRALWASHDETKSYYASILRKLAMSLIVTVTIFSDLKIGPQGVEIITEIDAYLDFADGQKSTLKPISVYYEK